MSIRTHPCEAYEPIEYEAGVPWMRIPGALRYRALVPRGLLGPPAICRGRSLPHPSGAGFVQVGFSALSMTSHWPIGVGYEGDPAATSYVLSRRSPSYRESSRSERSTMIVCPRSSRLTSG